MCRRNSCRFAYCTFRISCVARQDTNHQECLVIQNYTHIYRFIYTYIYVCVCVCVYIYIDKHIYIYITSDMNRHLLGKVSMLPSSFSHIFSRMILTRNSHNGWKQLVDIYVKNSCICKIEGLQAQYIYIWLSLEDFFLVVGTHLNTFLWHRVIQQICIQRYLPLFFWVICQIFYGYIPSVHRTEVICML